MDFSRFPRKALEAGATLFVEGDAGSALYVLLNGELSVSHGETVLATLAEPLTIVGEMSSLTGGRRAATVRAAKRTTLIEIKETERLFEHYPQLGFKLARILAGRLAGMNRRLCEVRERLIDAVRQRDQESQAQTLRMSAEELVQTEAVNEQAAVDRAAREIEAWAKKTVESDGFHQDMLDALDYIFDDSLEPGS
jgi:CRP-like cAMP-binding protein